MNSPSSRHLRLFSRSRFRAEEKPQNDQHGSWRPRVASTTSRTTRRALAHITPKPAGVDHLYEPTKPFPDARLA